jgi:phosphatidylglycerophosphatase C
MQLALFDFDGTITRKDSLLDFIYYAVGPFNSWAGFLYLIPCLMAFKLGVLPNDKTKAIVLSYFFKGWDEQRFQQIAQNYSLTQIDLIVRESARQKIQWHQQQGHKIIIITASLEHYLQDWCSLLKIELIGTRLEFKEGKYTGKLATPNCHGPEKVHRLRQIYDLRDFEHIYAYGDSSGDYALKTIANEFYFRVFDK